GGGNSVNALYVYVRAKTVADLSDPYTTLGAEEVFNLDIQVLGGRQLSARDCFVRLVIGDEQQELTFRGARVLTSEVGDWCHIPLDTDGLGYRVDGAFV